MRHDRVWANLVDRAIKQGGLDVETFVRQAIDSGMNEENIQERLLNDLNEGGPIFGKFFRHLTGAAEGTAVSAHRTGGYLGDVASDPDMAELLDLADMDDVIEIADPQVMDEIQQGIADRMEYMWVCALKNTCHYCLPLHGTQMTMAEWDARGLNPDSIHPAEWGRNTCMCTLIPVRQVGDRVDVMGPLVRQRLETETGLKGWAKTRRAVTQIDLDKARAKATESMQTKQGRRTMRILGRVNPEGGHAFAERDTKRQPERPPAPRGRR